MASRPEPPAWIVRYGAFLGAGFMFLLGSLPWLVIDLVATLPRQRVVTVSETMNRGLRCQMRLSSGDALSARAMELSDSSDCPVAGTIIEKRRWELGYRFNDREAFVAGEKLGFSFSLLTLGIVFVAIGTYRARRP